MREPRPFFRKQTRSWYVEINGKQVPLGRDRNEAIQKYHALMAKRRAGQIVANDSVCKLLNLYLGYCDHNLSVATFTKNKFHLRRFAEHIGVALKITELKPFHVQQWIDEKYKGKSDTYKNVAMTAVKGALKWAADQGYIEYSPIAKLKKPTAAVREYFVPSVDWAAVVEAANGRCFKDYLTVAFSTGARPQEMRKVQACNFEPQRRRLVFSIPDSKGKRRQRVIYLDDVAFPIIERLAKEYPEGPLFRDSRGNAWKKDALKDRFKRLRARLKIKGLTATVLRHS